MVLVFSSHLQPHGPNGLAAVRFSCPVWVYRLRIFPNGAPLFENARHMRSVTSPDAFYLDVFFNAQSVRGDGKDRQRPANALVPTSISYAGGLMDFAVDMGSEYATRLVIVKGSFERLSLAIYGHVVNESPPMRELKPIVPLEPEPLAPHLDPAHAPDPTALAKSLLELIPNAPSLPLAIRLVFCLKPTLDDWDIPGFPYIYASLDNDTEDYDLDSIVANLDRPIPEDFTQDTLDRFVERLTDFVGFPSVDQAYQIANVLNLSASQSPLFSQVLLNALDFSSIFTSTTLSDTLTLKTLTDACSNAFIARHFLTQTTLLNILSDMRDSPSSMSNRTLVSSIVHLQTRILGWQAFENALSCHPGENGWSRPAGLVYDVCREEQALGNWLASMILHDDILARLAEHPPPPATMTPSTPPVLFDCDPDDDDESALITHDDFIAFVRACVGIVAVLGVLAWADSVGNVDCRERTLAVIHLWQTVDGYREIVNHLFLLRQLTRRLNWIITDKTTDNDPPRHSGLLAERVLCSLLLPPVPSSHPHPAPFSSTPSHCHFHFALPALNLDLIQTILSLSQPLAFIPEHERLAFRKLALVVDDGLPAAVEELVLVFNNHLTGDNAMSDSEGARRPISLRRVRILRVGIGLVLRELGNDDSGFDIDEGDMIDGDGIGGEWRVLEAFGAERTFGFVERLVDLFRALVEDLTDHFVKGFRGRGQAHPGTSSTTVNGNGSTNTVRVGAETSGPEQTQDLIEQLFATTRELLLLIHRLAIKAFPLTVRGLRTIVSGIVDLVSCADSAFSYTDIRRSQKGKGRRQQQTTIERVSRVTRKTCVRILRAFAKKDVVIEPKKRKSAMEVVLRSLLMCGQVGVGTTYDQMQQGQNELGQDDVVGRVERVLELIERVLPSSSALEGTDRREMNNSVGQEEKSNGVAEDDGISPSQNRLRQLQALKRIKAYWAMNVFPLVLHELRLFMRLLPTEAQVRFVLLLAHVDEDGSVGVGEWLVEEEVKGVTEVLKGLVGSSSLLEMNEHGVEGIGNPEIEMKGDVAETRDVGGEEKFIEEQLRRKEAKKIQKKKEVLKAEKMVSMYRVYVGLQFLYLLVSSSLWFFDALTRTSTLSTHLSKLFTLLLEGHYTSPVFTSLLDFFSQPNNWAKLQSSSLNDTLDRLKVIILIGLLRVAQEDVMSEGVKVTHVKEIIKDEGVLRVLSPSPPLTCDNGGIATVRTDALVDAMRLEIGKLCAICSEKVGKVGLPVVEMVIAVLQWMVGYPSESDADGDVMMREEMLAKKIFLRGVTKEAFDTLCESFIVMLVEVEQQQIIHEIRAKIEFNDEADDGIIPILIELPDTLILSLSSMSSLLSHSCNTATPSSHTRNNSISTLSFSDGFPSSRVDNGSGNAEEGERRPSTPKGGQKTPDILGTVISPPTALLRSPAATGLTKTYANNDFRSLRQVSSARLNASRLPSMHVDDFENVSTKTTLPGSSSTSPLIVPVPIPIGDVSAIGGLLNIN